MAVWIGLSIGNLLFAYVLGTSMAVAAKISFFQAVAIFAYWHINKS